jgi:8-oxo-dGTP pyrophosphatase MutT (NUDIX family)
MAPIKSCGWIVYYLDTKDLTIKFLLIKRYAISKRIEWIAPKWKIEKGERPEATAIREVHEEAWIKKTELLMKKKVWDVLLSLYSEDKGTLEKDIAYYLIEYTWDPTKLKIIDGEWYLWVYKWAVMTEVLSLVYYKNLRNIYRKAYDIIKHEK